jgi:hypothetical protein
MGVPNEQRTMLQHVYLEAEPGRNPIKCCDIPILYMEYEEDPIPIELPPEKPIVQDVVQPAAEEGVPEELKIKNLLN